VDRGHQSITYYYVLVVPLVSKIASNYQDHSIFVCGNNC